MLHHGGNASATSACGPGASVRSPSPAELVGSGALGHLAGCPSSNSAPEHPSSHEEEHVGSESDAALRLAATTTTPSPFGSGTQALPLALKRNGQALSDTHYHSGWQPVAGMAPPGGPPRAHWHLEDAQAAAGLSSDSVLPVPVLRPLPLAVPSSSESMARCQCTGRPPGASHVGTDAGPQACPGKPEPELEPPAELEPQAQPEAGLNSEALGFWQTSNQIPGPAVRFNWRPATRNRTHELQHPSHHDGLNLNARERQSDCGRASDGPNLSLAVAGLMAELQLPVARLQVGVPNRHLNINWWTTVTPDRPLALSPASPTAVHAGVSHVPVQVVPDSLAESDGIVRLPLCGTRHF